MEWKSRRVEATLEQALVEDKATNDVTTALTIDPGLRASGTVVAKQDCVICGLGCIARFLEIFIRLDKRNTNRFEVINHPEMFDGVRVKKGQAVAVIRRNARAILACERVILNLMQRMSGISTAPGVCRRCRRHQGQGARHAQDRSRSALLDKYAVRCGGGREPSPRSFRRHSDQEQSHRAGRRYSQGAGPRACRTQARADRHLRSAELCRARSGA